MQAETSHIKQKLAEFIRKYYLQKLVFGTLATLLQLTIIFFIIKNKVKPNFTKEWRCR